MNIILFVMTMLMLLVTMTYARIETYRTSQVSQLFFRRYMQKHERGYVNDANDKLYIDLEGTPKNQSAQPPKPQAPRAKATPRISLLYFIDKKKREGDVKGFEETKYLLKTLIDVLYKDAPFYKEAIDHNPTVIDNLIQAIIDAIDARTSEKKITKAEQLANLKLSDPILNDLLYKMLLGTPFKGVLVEETTGTEDQEDDSLKEEGKEYIAPNGYISLLNYVNLSLNRPIRVYLASQEVLLTAFGQNKDVVKEIIGMRKNLYREATHDGDVSALSQQFADAFKKLQDSRLSDKALDFTVSKTNPVVYK